MIFGLNRMEVGERYNRRDKYMTKIVVNATPLLAAQTGISRYIRELYSQLEANPEFACIYYAGFRWHSRLPSLTDESRARVARAKGFFKRLLPKPYLLREFADSLLFRDGPKGFHADLVHEPNYIPPKSKLPTVITVHDLSWKRHPETLPKDRLRWLQNGLRKAIDRCAGILTVSEFSRREVLDVYQVPEEKVITTPLGVGSNFRVIQKSESESFLKSNKLSYKGYILSLGSQEPRKNLSGLILAYLDTPADFQKCYPLIVAGPKGWGENAMKTAGLKSIPENIRFVGFVPEQDLPKLYSCAKAFVMPSLYEGFGLPILEAMACGTPVVVSKAEALTEITQGKAGIELDRCDRNGWSDTIVKLCQDESLSEKLVKEGFLRIKDYTWSATAENTLKAFQAFLK